MGGAEGEPVSASEQEAPDDLAARLRAAAAGNDREAFGDCVSALCEGREAEEGHQAQEAEWLCTVKSKFCLILNICNN